jgi:hypothetical protein
MNKFEKELHGKHGVMIKDYAPKVKLEKDEYPWLISVVLGFIAFAVVVEFV